MENINQEAGKAQTTLDALTTPLAKSIRKCGVLGKSLPHSYSPQIHAALTSRYTYEIIEREENELEELARNAIFDGFNVTIPYKKNMHAMCEQYGLLSDAAKTIGAVNTVARLHDGTLYGDNTDAYGFAYMLHDAGIDVAGRNCLILGTGGASVAVEYALRKLKAASISFCSRNGEINYDNVLMKLPDTEVIVNTTPVGMYPNVDLSPLAIGGPASLDKFKKLQAVADIIYNPSRTRLLYDATKLGIKTAGGLSMLVAQAYKAQHVFEAAFEFTECDATKCSQGAKMLCIPSDEELTARGSNVINQITRSLEDKMLNITLVGMPGSGKSFIGKQIAEKTGREFVDLDVLFGREVGRIPSEVIEQDGEEQFRRLETEVAKGALARSGLVISTGGGIVTRERNEFYLKMNSRVIYIDRALAALEKQDKSDRPISRKKSIASLLEERAPLYEKVADETWSLGDFSPEADQELREKIEGLQARMEQK